MSRVKPNTVEEYIAGFPKETQKVLQEIRSAIQKSAPQAEEVISYAMPAFKLKNSILVYFAGYKAHIGLYPAPVGMETFKKEFSKYKTGKGSVQFPLDEPMPLSLITKIVKFKLKQSSEAVKAKKLSVRKK